MKWWTGLFTTRDGSFSYPSWHSEAKSWAVQSLLTAVFPLWFTYTSVLFTTRPFRRESVRNHFFFFPPSFSFLFSLLRLLLILLLFRKEVCWKSFFPSPSSQRPPPPPPRTFSFFSPFISFAFSPSSVACSSPFVRCPGSLSWCDRWPRGIYRMLISSY